MRPTIPLSAWRIAVDLGATRTIRRQTGHPAENCTCADCTTWRGAAPIAFPPELDEQLHRLGIRKDEPTELYVTGRSEGSVDFRVMYHVVGKILSGPAPWVDGIDETREHYYHAVQVAPAWIGLRVCTARDSFEYAPAATNVARSDVLCIDFRLQVDTSVSPAAPTAA